MKRLLIAAALICNQNIWSQNLDYLNNDPEWCVTREHGYGDDCTQVFEEVHYINGETELDSIIYKNLYSRGVHTMYSNTGIPCPNNYYNYDNLIGYIRQDGAKLYMYDELLETDRLMYDFTLEIGDTIPGGYSPFGDPDTEEIFPYYYGPHVITNIDSVQINNDYFKRFFFEIPNGQIEDTTDYYVEGVGHPRGFVFPYSYFFEGNHYLHTYRQMENLSYYEFSDGLCEFNVSINEYEIQNLGLILSPNPASSQLEIQVRDNVNIEKISIYSLDGKLISKQTNFSRKTAFIDISHLQNGIYLLEVINVDGFQEIKRFVVIN